MRLNATYLLTGLVLFGAGCNSMIPLSPWKKSMPAATQTDPVVEILGLWQPAEGTGLDGLPARGFAGQLLFFNRGSKSPVKVDGDIRIYVFDDFGEVEDQSTPIDQLDFVEDTWQAHLHVGTLGPSYNVFIPYSRKANKNQAKCTLRVRLKPENGPTVFSEMVAVTLPGPISEEMKRRAEQRSKNLDAEVKDTLSKLAKERDEADSANKAKPSKFKTISLERTRNSSGKTVTRIADSGEAPAETAAPAAPVESKRMDNLERKMEQLVELMTKQQQPSVATVDTTTQNVRPIQQVSAEVTQPANEPHPLSFRVKPTRPLSPAATSTPPQQAQPTAPAPFNQHPLDAAQHPFAEQTSAVIPATATATGEHPLSQDQAQILFESLSFEGPETASPQGTFRDHPLSQ